ncbi:hypothetical protein Fot_30842 [Forsythia ovata]|uniref:Uncharacterized protein n=1 Tax=Forsythia ovata TaxID=205694 RepID=A0ABD1T3A1_9LAMI
MVCEEGAATESPYFTVNIHHGGIMLTKSNNLVYEPGEVDYMDYVHSSILNIQLLDKLVEGDKNGATAVDIYIVPPTPTHELEWNWSIPIPHRPLSPDYSNVRKGLVIIDPETKEELHRLDPMKLQCKAKREKRKSK